MSLAPDPIPDNPIPSASDIEQGALNLLAGGRLAQSQRTVTSNELVPIVELIRDLARLVNKG